jgi:CheY-like chemotaxis protein
VLGEHVAQLDMVGTGRLAVEAVRSGGYDLVLMDLNMPEMDGDVATRLLREEGVGLPIIAVSADVLPETRQGCVSAGFSGFVCKPFTADGLLTALHRVVSTA